MDLRLSGTEQNPEASKASVIHVLSGFHFRLVHGTRHGPGKVAGNSETQ